MKKYLFILGMTVTLFAACSTDDELTENPIIDEDEQIAIEDLNSDVPITFGTISGEAVTRGTVSSTQFQADNIGIFMLSRTKYTAYGNNWYFEPGSNYDYVTRKLNIWQENVAANVKYNQTGGYSYLEWADNTEDHYYPKVQRYAYEFVAYYPRTDSVYFIYYNNNTKCQRVYANIEIDGSQDVMYAHPGPPSDNTDGWTSEYFKQHPTATPPHFSFEHKLPRLTFKVKLKGDFANVGTYYVDSLYLDSMPSKVTLYLAHRSSPGAAINGGTILTTQPIVKKNFHLREANGDFVADHYLDYQVTTAGTSVGDAIFIPPSKKEKLALRVVLRDASGSRYRLPMPITVTPPSTGWESGKSYNIVVTLQDPVKVEAKASVLDYTNYDDTENVLSVSDENL